MTRLYLLSDKEFLATDDHGRPVALDLYQGHAVRLVAIDPLALCLEPLAGGLPCRHCEGTGKQLIRGEGL